MERGRGDGKTTKLLEEKGSEKRGRGCWLTVSIAGRRSAGNLGSKVRKAATTK